MGRMLEMMKYGDGQRGAAPVAANHVVEWSLPDDAPEIPFIEVGGPKKLEASPQVLAAKHPAQPAVQPPHAVTEKGLAVQPPVAALALRSVEKVVAMTPARPMSVAFEPWPTTRKLTRAVAPELMTYHQPDHAISQQYLALFDQVTQGLRDGNGVLLLSGIRNLVGTSTVLLNLALAGARHRKKRIVVVEASPAKPSLAPRLGLETSIGIVDVLGGAAALEKAISEGPVAGLYLLPAQGETPRQTDSVFTPEATRWLISWLRDRFDLVGIDGPNLDNTLAVGVLAPLADDMFLVAPQGEKQLFPPGLAQTITRLGGRLRGLIHTQFEV